MGTVMKPIRTYRLAMDRTLWLNGKNGSLWVNKSSCPCTQPSHIKYELGHKKRQGSPGRPTGKVSDGDPEGQSIYLGTVEQRAGQPMAA